MSIESVEPPRWPSQLHVLGAFVLGFSAGFWLAAAVLRSAPPGRLTPYAILSAGVTLVVGPAVFRRLRRFLGRFVAMVTPDSDPDVQAALRYDLDPETARVYARIEERIADQRGPGSVDPLSLVVLAAAREGKRVLRVRRWTDTAEVGSPADFDEELDRLVDAGIIGTRTPDGAGTRSRHLQFEHSQLRRAAPGQIAAVATSVLS